MSFHNHTSQRWSQNWYIAFILLPAILWFVLTFVSTTVFWVGLVATIVFYWFARRRFKQTGNQLRSKEKAILMSAISLVGAIVLARYDYTHGGIAVSQNNLWFVVEMTLIAGTYMLVLLSVFLPQGISEAVENSVDSGGGRVSTFISG